MDLASPPTTHRQSGTSQDFWERYFTVYDTLNQSPLYRRMVLRHAEILQPAAGDAILDAGAGTGNVSQVLAVSGARVIGIDFCAPALARCRAKVPAAEFREADLTRLLPFESVSFDKIACSLVLHFLEPARQRGALDELFRVLRPGGLLAVTVFGTGLNPVRVYSETIRELARTEGLLTTVHIAVRYLINTSRILYYQWRIKRGERAGNYQYFTADSLRSALEAAGFSVTSIEPTLAGQCLIAGAFKPTSDATIPM